MARIRRFPRLGRVASEQRSIAVGDPRDGDGRPAVVAALVKLRACESVACRSPQKLPGAVVAVDPVAELSGVELGRNEERVDYSNSNSKTITDLPLRQVRDHGV